MGEIDNFTEVSGAYVHCRRIGGGLVEVRVVGLVPKVSGGGIGCGGVEIYKPGSLPEKKKKQMITIGPQCIFYNLLRDR